jgi:hypothetical protein
MKKDLTLYEESFELKELGFDEPCLAVFDGESNFKINTEPRNWNDNLVNGNTTSCPTYSQAFRWFREKHQLIHHMYWVYKKKYDGIDWIFHIKGINMINNNVVPHDETRFETYEEAELACLKHLIKIVKNK